MCGICGVCQKGKINKKELEEAVKRMNVSQKNRGPDDEGILVECQMSNVKGQRLSVAMGHRRLSIIDLSKSGHQPMLFKRQGKGDKGKESAITFNGEIYNFLELKKDLEQKGYKFKTKTDTEVILALYAEYGEKSFSMLRGMFAFGLYDVRRRKLFLVKDRYGVKPLYYYADNEKLVFASTVKALENSGIIPVQKNPEAFIGFMLLGSVPLPFTTIKNVFAVPAGHYLVREINGKQKLVKYYEPLDCFNMGKSDLQNINVNVGRLDFQNIEKIRELLKESVNYHLISDAPLGVFLSGGLDSSAIAALSAEALREGGFGRKITTLSIIFNEPEFSEEYYSDLVAKKINSDHCKIKITKQDFYDSLDDVFEAMDQPTIDGINTFFIARAAKQAGLKTVLSGLGADEIFLGYPHFRLAELLKKIQQLPLKPVFQFFSSSVAKSLFGDRYSKLSYFANDDILSFYLGVRGLFTPQETAKILDINESEVNDFIINMETSDAHRTSDVQRLNPVDLLSYLELKFYLQNQLLKDTDFMSMRHSIEIRVPFLDHKLVEYVSSLSSESKLSALGGKNLKTKELKNINKPLLVEAVKDLLPQEIFARPKMGFTFPFQKWLQNSPITNYQLPIAKTHWSRFWAKTILNKFSA